MVAGDSLRAWIEHGFPVHQEAVMMMAMIQLDLDEPSAIGLALHGEGYGTLPLKLGDIVFARIHNMLIINDLGCTFALVPPLTWGCKRLSTTFPIISPRSSKLCALSCATKTSWLAIACDRKISPANAN